MKAKFGAFASRFGSLAGLFVLGAILAILSPDFLTLSNLMNILNQVSLNGLVAVGMRNLSGKKGVEILTSTKGESLIKNAAGKVIGVVATSADGGKLILHAALVGLE